ncbi:MAG: hypothetical protein U5K43_15275 [Halofilum sp. (in: g-proteobacteria)]|nr:hypothetical protein [Halofilum sp. (in: g-proteobacteria)]
MHRRSPDGRARAARARLARAPGGALTFSLARRFARAPRELAPLSLVAGVALAEVLRDVGPGAGRAQVAQRHPGRRRQARRDPRGGRGRLRRPGARDRRHRRQHRPRPRRARHRPAGHRPAPRARVPVERGRLAGPPHGRAGRGAGALRARGRDRRARALGALDALQGQAVRVEAPAGVVEGVAAGIDAGGALRVRTAAGERCFVAGEATLRAAP